MASFIVDAGQAYGWWKIASARHSRSDSV